MPDKIIPSDAKKGCASCGAALSFKPGSTQLNCDYCGYEEFIEASKSSFEELELSHYLNLVGNHVFSQEIEITNCKSCGANQHIEKKNKSLDCIYCYEPLVMTDIEQQNWIAPGAIIPFQIEENQANAIFQKWIKSFWFAPNNLKKAALDPEKLQGLYLPYWTFDAQLFAEYQGERGDYYFDNIRVKTTNGIENRRVQKTRWSKAYGEVNGFIDDILISASKHKNMLIPEEIENWDLKNTVPFNKKFLSGFITDKYSISLKEGHLKSFQEAKYIAENWIREDIGGNTQRINQSDIKLSKETFKHILLPVYTASYRYNGKVYRFFINGQNAKISGESPTSYWKIFFLVLGIGFFLILYFQFF